VVRLLFAYPWSGKVSILTLEEEGAKPGSSFLIVCAVALAVCLSSLSGLLASFSGNYYFSLVSQIYHRDGLFYLWQPLAVFLLEIVSVLVMAFLIAYRLERWHDYRAAKWVWFSFVVTAGVVTATMHLALFAWSWLPRFLAPNASYSSAAFSVSVIVGFSAFTIIFGSLYVFLTLALHKVKSLVQTHFYEQYRVPIGLALCIVWTCFLLGPSAIIQSLQAVHGDPAKRELLWKIQPVGMTMIGCDAVEKSLVCSFTIAPHELPDLVAAGRWRGFDGSESTHGWVAWEAVSDTHASTIAILPGKVLDLTLRAGRDDVCAQTAKGKARLHFQARARGTTPPFNERQRLPLVVTNAETFAQELMEMCG
jgi:MFS family permease